MQYPVARLTLPIDITAIRFCPSGFGETGRKPTYREVRVSDLRSANDLADIAFGSGVQLGAGKVVSVRSQELASSMRLEQRLRNETSIIVEQLLAGWRTLTPKPRQRKDETEKAQGGSTYVSHVSRLQPMKIGSNSRSQVAS